jgi:hypothetical protein
MSRKISTSHVKVLLDVDLENGRKEVESVWAIPAEEGWVSLLIEDCRRSGRRNMIMPENTRP